MKKTYFNEKAAIWDEVLGLRAKIACYPGEAIGTLTDVQVFLRRE